MPAATDRSTLSVRRLSRPLRCPHGHGVARESQPRRSRLRPDVAVGEDQAYAFISKAVRLRRAEGGGRLVIYLSDLANLTMFITISKFT